VNTYTIRPYTAEDCAALCALYSKQYARVNGYSMLDPERWKRAYPGNPDIGPNRILVAHNGGAQGYIAYAVTPHPLFPRKDYDAIIYDLCAERTDAALALARSCMRNIAAEGRHAVYSLVPRCARTARAALSAMGFQGARERFGMTVAFSDIARYVMRNESRLSAAAKKRPPVCFELYQDFSAATVSVAPMQFTLFARPDASAAIHVRCGVQTISDVFFGAVPAVKAYLSGAIRITPVWRAGTVLAILRGLILRGPWAVALVDWR